MKILSAEQIRQADQYTIKNAPISSVDLMENASLAFTRAFTEDFDRSQIVCLVCGSGNNGGDGLAVARMLKIRGYEVRVFYFESSRGNSRDNQINLQRLRKILEPVRIENHIPPNNLHENAVIVDAIFGSGLNKPIKGRYAKVIDQLNALPGKKVAVDIPSGLFADKPIAEEDTVFHADVTYTFQVPKLSFFHPENQIYVGKFKVLNIGLMSEFIEKCPTAYQTLEPSAINDMLPRRNTFSHKGHFGKGLLISGSYGKMGATLLSARAAMRAGIGLLTVCTPQCGYQVIQQGIPEAMTIDGGNKYLDSAPEMAGYDIMAAGPGLGTQKETVKALKVILEEATTPMVLDADALNIIGSNGWMELIPKGSILTPHPMEFKRLAGEFQNSFERIKLQQEIASKYQLHVLVKGAFSCMAFPDGNVYFNTTGNPGMATAGAGDVLTGIIMGLSGQLPPKKALLAGVYLHGLAGDLAGSDFGEISLNASDIIHHLGNAIKKLTNLTRNPLTVVF